MFGGTPCIGSAETERETYFYFFDFIILITRHIAIRRFDGKKKKEIKNSTL